ncbi:Receptor-like protein 12 [Ananas comosus]|uniref:Receptor-like protein 12 n=1 Tax=Ananas comosus TaxID=4615 RepID=A0A199VM29_ANACO|nr:Receptor-like protein 12 [Ananas comosus]
MAIFVSKVPDKLQNFSFPLSSRMSTTIEDVCVRVIRSTILGRKPILLYMTSKAVRYSEPFPLEKDEEMSTVAMVKDDRLKHLLRWVGMQVTDEGRLHPTPSIFEKLWIPSNNLQDVEARRRRQGLGPIILCVVLSRAQSIQAFAASGCFETERNALLAFKADLIDPHNRLASWKSQNCCAWKEVVCSNTTGHILKLNLRNSYDNNDFLYYGKRPSALGDNNLRGNLSGWLGNMTSLTEIDLTGNSLNGTIPLGVWRLTNLTGLFLDRHIPDQIGKMHALESLDVAMNKLSGTIPQSLATLSFRNTYFSAIDRTYDRLYVAVALTLIRLRRRCGEM